MNLFLKRVLKFFLVPIIIVALSVIGYFVFDPFKVLYPYDSYSGTQTNRDYVTIETFKKRYSTQKYDSFMFGSSRLMGYDINSWHKHLGSDTSPYKMEGFSENIYGIYSKLKYLDSHSIPIKNALIILDVDGTLASDLPQVGYMYRKHPETTNDSWFSFHKEQFLTYFNANMILRYFLFKVCNLRNNFVFKYYNENTSKIDSITNNLSLPHMEYAIQHNPYFFEGPVFYDRKAEVTTMPRQITESIYEKLQYIADVFHREQTKFKIIIGPIYGQEVYAEEDLKDLRNIFGEENIYDFSGKNTLTEDKHNYYENFHYRPIVGDSIMNYIYGKHN